MAKRQLWRSSDKKLLADADLNGVLARDKEGDARESGRRNLARVSNNLLTPHHQLLSDYED